MIFLDRADAGKKLARQLQAYAHRKDVVVLGIPRGGVPVAFEIAASLCVLLDVFICRKLGVPWQPEFAFGAIASGGVSVVDREIVEGLRVPEAEMRRVVEEQTSELERREKLYRGGQPPLDVRGRTVILVDDGIATGSSARAAIEALRRMSPAKIVLAVPVAPLSTCRRLRPEVDDLACVYMPEFFSAIGEFYEDFSQVSDEEVINLLDRAAQSPPLRTCLK